MLPATPWILSLRHTRRCFSPSICQNQHVVRSLKLQKNKVNSSFPNYAPLLTNKTSKSRLGAHFSYICCIWPRPDAFVCRQWSVIRKWAIDTNRFRQDLQSSSLLRSPQIASKNLLDSTRVP